MLGTKHLAPSTFLSVSELRSLLRERGIRPRRRWGQNFLVDSRAASRIIEAIGPARTDTVLEIGAGLGALTEGLAERAGRVVAVERDPALAGVLKERLGGRFSNLTVVESDVLGVRLKDQLASGETGLVVGNLPYSITSPVLEYLLENRRFWRRAYLTVQKEVADRLLARPGGKVYGSLSILVQFYAECERLFDLAPGAFFPRPEVDSSFLLLRARSSPKADVKDEGFFFRTVRAAFGKRRKILPNALAYEKSLRLSRADWAGVLEKLSIDPARRAETLSIEEFARIANAVGRES